MSKRERHRSPHGVVDNGVSATRETVQSVCRFFGMLWGSRRIEGSSSDAQGGKIICELLCCQWLGSTRPCNTKLTTVMYEILPFYVASTYYIQLYVIGRPFVFSVVYFLLSFIIQCVAPHLLHDTQRNGPPLLISLPPFLGAVVRHWHPRVIAQAR